jgi:hypothetical protein
MITFNKIASMVETDLKQALVDAGYVDSGALKSSIKVSFNKTTGQISIKALDYLKYLDDGKFYTNFMSKEMNKITPLIAKVITQDIKKELSKGIK